MTDQGGAGQPPVPGTSLEIDEEPSGSCLVFHVRGDVDFETADWLRDRVLTAAKGADPPRLVLDLAQVVYCDSSCMSALVAIWKAVNAADGAVILAEVPEQARRILAYTGLDRHFTLRETVPEAVTELSV